MYINVSSRFYGTYLGTGYVNVMYNACTFLKKIGILLFTVCIENVYCNSIDMMKFMNSRYK